MMSYTDSLELEHHGIKGMKWGVRRYQNADGTLTSAGKEKLKKYKDKEYARVSKRRDKYDKKYNLAKAKREAKYKVKPSRSETYNKGIRDTYEKELRAIKKMSYKDMQEDKIAVGKQWLKSAAFAAAGTATLSTIYWSPTMMIAAPTPSGISNAKTRLRVQREEYREKNRK